MHCPPGGCSAWRGLHCMAAVVLFSPEKVLSTGRGGPQSFNSGLCTDLLLEQLSPALTALSWPSAASSCPLMLASFPRFKIVRLTIDLGGQDQAPLICSQLSRFSKTELNAVQREACVFAVMGQHSFPSSLPKCLRHEKIPSQPQEACR